MDGISAAASVASIAAVGVSLSKTLYDVVAKINGGKDEIKDIANNVSLLALVLEELQDVLGREKLYFRPALERSAETIVSRCESIFNDIALHTGGAKGVTTSRLVWYFKRERVKPLRASLESLKSTLNIVLHVVQLAKTTQETEKSELKSDQQGPIRRERRNLVYHVIDNRLSVEKLRQLEEEVLQDKPELDVEGLPSLYDGTSPLPEVFQRKVKTDEEFEFVSASTSPAADDMWQSHLLERPEGTTAKSHSQDALQSPSNMINNLDSIEGKFSRQGRLKRTASTRGQDSGAKSPSQQSEKVAWSLPQPLTSALIMSVIPHQRADEALQSILHDSESEQLEAKAESTLETLLGEWTNVGYKPTQSVPKEPQARFIHFQNHFGAEQPHQNHASEGMDSSQALPSSSMPDEDPMKTLEGNSAEQGINVDDASSVSEIQSHIQEDPGNKAKATQDPNSNSGDGSESQPPPPPKVRQKTSVQDRKSAHGHRIKKDNKHSSTLPSSDTPVSSNETQSFDPYPYNYPAQPQYPPYPYYTATSHASPYSLPQPPNSKIPPAATSASAPAPTPAPIVNVVPFDTSNLGPKRRNNDDSIEGVVHAMEKALSFIERSTLERGALEAQHRELQEQCRLKAALDRSKQQEAAAEEAALNSRPVTVQDCIGRKYVFPLDMCRSWIVSLLYPAEIVKLGSV